MTSLAPIALASVRHRMPAFATTFLATAGCALLIGSFAGLAETATGSVSAADQEVLMIMGIVIGSWGALIAIFSLASTVSVAVRRRGAELTLLRGIGARPAQLRGMLRWETVSVTALAALLGALAALGTGRVLLAMVRDGEMVSSTVEYGGGVGTVVGTTLLVAATSLIAASYASRRALRLSRRRTDPGGDAQRQKTSRRALIVAALLIATALSGAMLTVFMMADAEDPYLAMITSGDASILAGVGVALLGIPILRTIAAGLDRWARRRAASHLAVQVARQRTSILTPVFGPAVVFVAATVGTLHLAAIDNRTRFVPPGMSPAVVDMISLLNLVVVGMIAGFAALMLVNAQSAATYDRAPEFTRLHLLGATRGQIRRALLGEGLLVGLAAGVLGTLAALTTVVSFSIARDEGVLPNGQLWLAAAVTAICLLLIVGACQAALARIHRTRTASAERSRG